MEDTAIFVSKGDGETLFVTFEFSQARVDKVKQVTRRWNPLGKYWELPFTEEALQKLLNIFADEEVEFESTIDFSWAGSTFAGLDSLPHINKINIRTEETLKLRGYSPQTIEVYIGHIERFLHFVKKKPVEVNSNDIEKYFLHLLEQKRRSPSYVNQAVSAIKFLFKYVEKNDLVIEVQLPRPKKEQKLPDILSREEVISIFNKVNNLKHKVILVLAYSAGLRVSEVMSLRVADIDVKRMLIHVRQGKGHKDRYTILSMNALLALRNYTKHIHLSDWLFPGEQEGKHLTERTAQKIFDTACKKAEIKKDVSIHSLRHYVESQIM